MHPIFLMGILTLGITACNGVGRWMDGSQSGQGVSVSEPNSSGSGGRTDGGGDGIVDSPVPVGGTYLVCAADYSDMETVDQQTFGCRLDADRKKIVVPEEAVAELKLFKSGTEVPSRTSRAKADSPWSWFVVTSAKGPFDAELTLRGVNIRTVAGLEVTPGSSSYRFQRAFVEGSALEVVPNGGVAALTLSATQTLDIVTVSFSSSFPKLLRSSTLAYGSVRAGFAYAGGREVKCRYLPSVAAPKFYEFAGNCQDDETPITVSLEDLIVGASAWTVELLDQTGAPANFSIESSVREFRK